MNSTALILTILSYTITDRDTPRANDIGIRLWGIDAPEMSDTGGSASKRFLRQLTGGEDLACNVKDIDHYGRIAAQCFLPDERDLACEMIKAGYAEEWVRFSGGAYQLCSKPFNDIVTF